MDCPYCRQRVHPQAVLCRHCRHDLTVVGRLQYRISELEAELARMALAAPKGTSKTKAASLRSSPRTLVAFLTVSAIVSIPVLAALTIRAYAPYPARPISLAAVPAIIGLCAGLIVPNARLRWMVAASIAYSLLATAGVDMLVFDLNLVEVFLYDARELAGRFLLLVAGGSLGRWIRRRRYQLADEDDVGQRLASEFSRARAKHLPMSQIQIDKLAKVINALAPILTFVATIVGAYLTYLAAISKPVERGGG